MSFHGKVTNSELESIGRDMESAIKEAGAQKTGYPVTTTYSIDGEKAVEDCKCCCRKTYRQSGIFTADMQ